MVGRVGFNHQHLKCYLTETTLPFSFIVQYSVKIYCDANRFQIQFHAFKLSLLKNHNAIFRIRMHCCSGHPVTTHISDNWAKEWNTCKDRFGSTACSSSFHPPQPASLSPAPNFPNQPYLEAELPELLGRIPPVPLDGHFVCSGQQRTQGWVGEDWWREGKGGQFGGEKGRANSPQLQLPSKQ